MEQSIDAIIAARDELCWRIAEGRRLRFGRTVHGTEFNDDPSMVAEETIGDDAPPIIFHLIYEDAKSKLTGRNFKLRKLIKKDNDITVGGICFLRHAYRHFLASRIVEVTDLTTGEISENGEAFFSKHSLLEDAVTELLNEEAKALRYFRDEIIILTFVAATDGQIHTKEIDELVKFVAFNWPEALNEKILREQLCMFVPDSSALFSAIDRLRGKIERLRPFNRALRAVVDADNRLHLNEQALAAFILSRLSFDH